MSTKEEAIKYIESLSEKEIVDFFYESTQNRRVHHKHDDGFEIETLCIVQSTFGEYNNEIDTESYHEFMALPSDELKDLDWVKKEKNITEQGKCNVCKALILCVTKEAICPICHTIVECT